MINENDEFHTEFELLNLSQGLLATCSKHYHLSERWKQIIRIKKKRRKKKETRSRWTLASPEAMSIIFYPIRGSNDPRTIVQV